MTDQTPSTQELRGLLERATGGPWQSFGRDILAFSENGISYNLAHVASRKSDATQDTANAALIVATVNALPALLDRIERLEEKSGERRIGKWGELRCMVIAEGYAMVRYKGAGPFIMGEKEWLALPLATQLDTRP